MPDPMTRCALPWCAGEHDTTDLLIHHHSDVGTISVQGEPLTVSLAARETRGGEPVVSAHVAARWPHIDPYSPGDGNAMDGLDVTAAEASAVAELLARAAARLRDDDQPPGLPADVGPYENDQQAAATVSEAYAAGPLAPAGTLGRFNRDRLTAACAAAGVQLGEYDRRILGWLSGWEPEVVAVVVGLVLRAAAVDGRTEQGGEVDR